VSASAALDIESLLIDAIADQPLSEVLRIAAAHAEVDANGGEYAPVPTDDDETVRPSGTRVRAAAPVK